MKRVTEASYLGLRKRWPKAVMIKRTRHGYEGYVFPDTKTANLKSTEINMKNIDMSAFTKACKDLEEAMALVSKSMAEHFGKIEGSLMLKNKTPEREPITIPPMGSDPVNEA